MNKFKQEIALEEVKRLSSAKELKDLADYHINGLADKVVILSIEKRLVHEFNSKYWPIVIYKRNKAAEGWMRRNPCCEVSLPLGKQGDKSAFKTLYHTK